MSAITYDEADEILDNYTGYDRAGTLAALVRTGMSRTEANGLLREIDEDMADARAEYRAMTT